MNKVVNLRQRRKQDARKTARKEADQNAVVYGLSKTQKALDEAQRLKAKRVLDGIKCDE